MFNMSLIIFKPNVVRYVYHGKCITCFNLSCQAEHTKINSQLNFNPGLAPLSPFEQPAPGSLDQHSTD